MECSALEEANVVNITPIISRSAAGEVIAEVGAGGGFGDLVQAQELELDHQLIKDLKQWCKDKFVDREKRQPTLDLIAQVELSKLRSVPMTTLDPGGNSEINLPDVLKRLAELVKRSEDAGEVDEAGAMGLRPASQHTLPRNIVSSSNYALQIAKNTAYENRCSHTRDTPLMQSSAISWRHSNLLISIHVRSM